MNKVCSLLTLLLLMLNGTAQTLQGIHPPADDVKDLIPLLKGETFTIRAPSQLPPKRNVLRNLIRIAGASAAAYQTEVAVTRQETNGKAIITQKNNWVVPVGLSAALLADKIAGRKKDHRYLTYDLYDKDLVLKERKVIAVTSKSLKKNGGIVASGIAGEDGFLHVSLSDDNSYSRERSDLVIEHTMGGADGEASSFSDVTTRLVPIPVSKGSFHFPSPASTHPILLPALRSEGEMDPTGSFAKKDLLPAKAPLPATRFPSLAKMPESRMLLPATLKPPVVPPILLKEFPEKPDPAGKEPYNPFGNPFTLFPPEKNPYRKGASEEESEGEREKEFDDLIPAADEVTDENDDDGGYDCNPADPDGGCYDPCSVDPDSYECACMEDPTLCSDCDPTDPNGGCYDPCSVAPDSDECQCVELPELCTNPCNIDPTSQECHDMCDKIASIANQDSAIQKTGEFTVPSSIEDELAGLGAKDDFTLQTLKNATGDEVNTDCYAVHIKDLPVGMDMDDFLEYFRQNLTDFSDSSGVQFSPYNYDGVNSTSQFDQSGPDSVGSLVHISMANDGTVVESAYQQDVTTSNGQTDSHFTFSTVTSPEDGAHPVSGNRTFGIQTDPVNGGYVFYITGVDRATSGLFNLGADMFGWDSASSLWQNVMGNVEAFVGNNGGNAVNYANGFLDTVQDYNNMKDFLAGTDSLSQEMDDLGCP